MFLVKVIASELDPHKHISSESVWILQDQSCMMTHNGSYDSWEKTKLSKINLVKVKKWQLQKWARSILQIMTHNGS